MPNEPKDALLTELMGQAVDGETVPGQASVSVVEPIDKGPQDDPLDVDPSRTAGPVSAVRTSDAVHSTKAGGRGYEVVVEGEYFSKIPGELSAKDKKPYRITVNLPSLDKALASLKKVLLPRLLPKLHPDYTGVRTINIVSARPLTPETPAAMHLQFMPKEALEKYIAEQRVPVVAKDYSDVTHLREAVIDYVLNPKGFEEREIRRQKVRAEEAELLKLNPGAAE
jgi:hypothetical protein